MHVINQKIDKVLARKKKEPVKESKPEPKPEPKPQPKTESKESKEKKSTEAEKVEIKAQKPKPLVAHNAVE